MYLVGLGKESKIWKVGEGRRLGGGEVKLRLIKYPFMSDRLRLDLGSSFLGFLVLMLVGGAFVFFPPPVDWDCISVYLVF